MSCKEGSGAPMILPAARQDAFYGAPVECVQDGYGSFRSLELAEEVEAPLGFLRQ